MIGSVDLNVLNELLVIASPFQHPTTLELLPQAPCVGPAVADVGPSFPNSTEWGFEKALSSCALQPFSILFPNSRFSERPDDIPDDTQPALRDKP